MNRTIKEATVERYHFDSHDQLRQLSNAVKMPPPPLLPFLGAALRIKVGSGGFICN